MFEDYLLNPGKSPKNQGRFRDNACSGFDLTDLGSCNLNSVAEESPSV